MYDIIAFAERQAAGHYAGFLSEHLDDHYSHWVTVVRPGGELVVRDVTQVIDVVTVRSGIPGTDLAYGQSMRYGVLVITEPTEES
jgi:hypothetical protein